MTTDPPASPETISGVPLTEAISALRVILMLALAVVLPLVALGCGEWGAGRARGDLLAETRGSMAVFRANLVSEIEKNEAVPFLLAQSHEIISVLSLPSKAATDRLNHRLTDTADAVHASAIYVMNADGTTVAASNWNLDSSFVGQNFSYRPYFRAALGGAVGRYFALGTTSHQPGYYIAYPVRAENRTGAEPESAPLGAVVIKVGMERVEQGWTDGPERVIVTDSDGVIVITNTPGWRFHSLKPLAPADLARIQASQKYAGLPITALPVTEQPLDDSTRYDEGDVIGIGNQSGNTARFALVSSPVPGTDWTLHVLLDTGPIRAQQTTAAVIGAFGTLILILAGFHVLQRWMRWQERLADQVRARQDLEQRVRTRTADLANANDRLLAEMRQREHAQEVLRTAQSELVQAAKLAALGQMSAGIAHEINQPLSAIRSFADNAVILLERGRTNTVRDNLEQIAELTQRMASITQQLKGFARKAAGTLGPVMIRDSIDKALALVAPQLRAEAIRVVRPAPAEPPPLLVLAEDVRLQQVLVNLFGNAIDAVKGRAERVLTIGLCRDGAAVVLTVRDSGPGIAPDDLPLLFEPFFTTKAPVNGSLGGNGHGGNGHGGGLGLGLSISSGIVQDFGGTIAAANCPDGGAEFTVRLQPAELPQ